MRAVLFDLGNTLVSYYAAAEFAPVLRQCMRGCMSVLEPHARGDEEELFQSTNTEAVFVGDDPRWDVAGAKRAGVRPILLARRPAEGTSDESIPTVANLREVLHFLS
jgi:FMN phosphatase YigB (HAD superfamily)